MKDKILEKNSDVPVIGMLNKKGFDVQRLPEDPERTLQLLEDVK